MTHRRLVLTNRLRTMAWSLHAGLVLWVVGSLMHLSWDEGPMKRFTVGDRAPRFSATAHDGSTITVGAESGERGLVLFFYPRDGTPVCTKEACAFRDTYEQFLTAGFDVVGVSSDTADDHHAFAQQYRLPFPLIADTDGSLRKAFSIGRNWGIFPGRVTFVIDRQGIIRQVYSAQFASDEHVRQALQAIGVRN